MMYQEFPKKMPQSRNKARFVMYIIINWSYPTKFSIEQEPLKIFKIVILLFSLYFKAPSCQQLRNSAYK